MTSPIRTIYKRWTESGVWGRVAAVVAAVVALSPVLFGLWNLYEANDLQRENNRLQQAALDSHFEEVMMGLDRHFVTYPRLRPFFYSSRSALPPAGPLRHQALGTAELIIDFADDVGAYMRMRKMDPTSAERWAEIVRAYFNGSAVTRLAWASYHGPYGETTACILGAPYGRERLEVWNWRLNVPHAPRPSVCS